MLTPHTYGLRAPVQTHFRPATCAEIGCSAYLNGWKTILPVGSDLIGVLKNSGRKYVQVPSEEGGLAEFHFEPGQPCFKADTHVISLEREPIYLVRRGGQTQQHRYASDWVDDSAIYLDKVRDEIEKG